MGRLAAVAATISVGGTRGQRLVPEAGFGPWSSDSWCMYFLPKKTHVFKFTFTTISLLKRTEDSTLSRSPQPRKTGAVGSKPPASGCVMSCVSLDILDSIRKLRHLLQNKLFICICSVSIVFNLYLYILDTPWISCQNPGSDSDLCSPPETRPRGLPPRPGGDQEAAVTEPVPGRGSRPGPLLRGAGPHPLGATDPWATSPSLRQTVVITGCWPNRILTEMR